MADGIAETILETLIDPRIVPDETNSLAGIAGTWWFNWELQNYSWEGLKGHIARGLYVDRDGEFHTARELKSAFSESKITAAMTANWRPATLRDLYADQDEQLLVCPVTGTQYTYMHAPLKWPNGEPVDLDTSQLDEVKSKLQELGQLTSFQEAKSEDDFDFSEDITPSPFEGVIFRHGISFLDGDLTNYLHLRFCWLQNIQMSNSSLNFSFEMSNCLVQSSANFSNVDFSYSVKFWESTFMGLLTFESCRFKGQVEWIRGPVTAVVRIRNCDFTQVVSLSIAANMLFEPWQPPATRPIQDEFEELALSYSEYLLTDCHQILISGSSFQRGFNAQGSKFFSGFSIMNSQFGGAFDLGNSEYGEFSGAAEFEGALTLHRNRFDKTFHADDLVYTAEFSITSCVFSEQCKWNRMTYAGEDRFPPIHFTDNIAKGPVFIEIGSWKELLYFSGFQFQGGLFISFHDKLAINRDISRLASLPTTTPNLADQLELDLLHLDRCLETARFSTNINRSIVLEREFNRLQWRIRRKCRAFKFENVASLFYDRFLGFGLDVFRPLVFVAAVIALATSAYSGLAIAGLPTSIKADLNWFLQSGLSHALDVVSFARSTEASPKWIVNSMSFKEMLPSRPTNSTNAWFIVRVIEVVQLVLTLLGLFCSSLAIRRKFQV